MAEYLFIRRLCSAFSLIFFFVLLSKNGIGQMTHSKKAIDSTIEANKERYIKAANCMLYFSQSAWGGEKLYIINLDQKIVQDLNMLNNVMSEPRKIKSSLFLKLQKLMKEQSGDHESIVNMDDGAEGMFKIYKSQKLEFKFYYLGIIPEKISKLSLLIRKL